MVKRKPRRVKLKEWAELMKLDPPPAEKTLRRWARDCWIHPPPVKVGRDWRVDEDARFVGPNYENIGDVSAAA